MLVDALEKLAARARRRRSSTADASDTAQRFLREARLSSRSSATRVTRGDEWLANTTMEKQLGGEGGGAMSKPDTPFPRHWLYYIVLKYGVIACVRSPFGWLSTWRSITRSWSRVALLIASMRELSVMMTRERLYLFDTTLRDGAQTNGVDFTLARQARDRAHARRARHRLCRGRLSRRQPDRHRVLRRGPQARARPSPPSA